MERGYKFPDLHVHTAEGSLRDTGSTCEELVSVAAELGTTAMAVTDHGTMTAIQDFRVACEKANIKPIYGCEFYVDMGDGARTHLIVLAKNLKGYNAISKVCTLSAYNMHNDRPIVTLDMLREWFAAGKPGHGNVIATSACMQGPLCRQLLTNFYIDINIEKVKKKRDKEKSPEDEEYKVAIAAVSEAQTAYDDVKAVSKKNTEIAKTPWKKTYNAAVRSGDPEAIASAETLMKSIEVAQAKKETLKIAEKTHSAKLKAKKEELIPLQRSVDRYNKEQEKIKELERTKLSPEEAKKNAQKTLTYFVCLFGRSNFYIELQNHGIPAEIYAMPILVDLAKENHIKLVATNDVHYAIPEKAEVRHYNHVQYQHYGYTELEEQDRELYLKTDSQMYDCLIEIIPKDAVLQAIENTYRIAEECNVKFEITPHYPVFPTADGAKIHLRRLIQKGKKKVKPWTETYQKRLQYELNVIEKMGFSDYLCIVEDFLNYARLVGKIDLDSEEFTSNPYDMSNLRRLARGQVGEGCGPGRGSAAGSLVCYLVGITNIDPIENDLLFERFLNPERVTMPDIDSDIAPKVRPWVIGYIKNRYGEKAVAQIMTRSYFGAKSSIQAAARVLGKMAGDEKAFLGISMEMSKSIEDPNAPLESMREELVQPDNPDTETIFNIAVSLEGLPSGYGTHAAGIVVSDNSDISDYTPLINISGAIDTQLDLNWVEPMGMLKLDLLGLRNLGIITECEKAVQKEYGIDLSMDKFPYEPEVFSEIFAKGLTDGVFQFESDGMKKLLMSFGPESISDLTLLNAMFRPGPLQYIDDVTAVKKGEKSPKYIIPEMAEILDVTYGKPIYQEQIMAIFNRFAGFSLGESDIIRRLMSKKKVEAFTAYKDKFIDGLVAAGATKLNAEKFWTELLDFSQYAFNKSHSRAYSEVAYATAYLKWKYPDAYFCGLLNYTNNEKMPKMILDAKNQGVDISCPDINYSSTEFSIYGSKVFFGLRPIPQVAASATDILEERTANGKFTSFKDFLYRCQPKKNVAENLIKAGAFDSMGSRPALLSSVSDLLDYLKKSKDKEKDILEMTDEKRKERALATKLKWDNLFEEYEFSDIEEDKTDSLNAEKELLGAYISGHPMNGVWTKNKLKKVEFGKNVFVTALASEIEEKVTKTSGKPMLTLKISDTTDIVDAIMFPGDFEKLSISIEEGKIYDFNGVLKQDMEEVKFFVKRIFPHTKKPKPIYIKAPSYEAFKRKEKAFQSFVDIEKGRPTTVLFEKETGYGKCLRLDELYSPDIKTILIESPDFSWD